MLHQSNLINEHWRNFGMDMLSARPGADTFGPREGMTVMDMGLDDESQGPAGLTRSDSVDDSGGMGGGRKRRKQSKPIRVFMDMEEAEMANALPPELAAAAAEQKLQLQQQQAQQQHHEAMETSQDLAPCDLCNASFGSQAALTDHIQAVHNIEEEGAVAFPTKYHRLGSEFQEEAMHSVISIEPGEQGQLSPNSQGESGQPGCSSPTDKTSANKNRGIFHQDAYCDLCDREFCNRYFLKTHKANKHGIYESEGNSPIGANGFPSMGSPTRDPLAMSGGSGSGPSASPPRDPTPVSHATPPLLPPPPPHSSSSAPCSSAPPSSTPSATPAPRSTTPSAGAPPTSSSSSTTSSSSKPAEDKPTKTPDMEDYCEICQKHFCNKYYLKKHKQDVHGIIPDTPVNKRSRNSTGSNSSASGISTTQSLGLPPNPAGLSNGLPNMSSMANVMFLNPFAPPVMLPQPMLQGLPGAFVPPGLQLAQLPPISSVSGGEPPKVSTPLTTIAPSMPQSSEAMRGMGILNADAYCDICRKEFCNRYFLKIHLANKHGIYTEDSPPPPGAPFFMPGPNGMGFPMPMMGDKPMMMENGHKEGPPSENGEPKEREDDRDHICKICKQSFPNHYSLRVHQMNVHKLSPGEVSKAERSSEGREGGSSIKQEDQGPHKSPAFPMEGLNLSTSEANISGTIFSNMIAAKLADRVVCDICNKEVCNKYFLKTHKFKVHGIQVEGEEPKKPKSENNKENNSMSLPPMPPHPQLSDAPTDLSKKSSVVPPNPVDPAVADAKRPPDEELLKMGIDPEAYCEICKKEFCSKYFLRTHKLNIHGIKVERTPEKEPHNGGGGAGGGGMGGPGGPVNRHGPVNAPVTPLSIPTPFIPTSAPLPFYPPHFMPDHPDFSLGMDFRKFEQEQQRANEKQLQSWKWREPINATRVMCELCNKELCNKYFLRTHMQNKHGISYDPCIRKTTKSESSRNNTPSHSPGRQHSENSNSSGPSDMRSKESVIKSTGAMGEKQRPVLNVPSLENSSNSSQRQFAEDINVSIATTLANINNTIMAKTWRVPEDMREMAAHHPLKMPNGSAEDMFRNKCDICGLIFGEPVTLQLHKMRDHGIREGLMDGHHPGEKMRERHPQHHHHQQPPPHHPEQQKQQQQQQQQQQPGSQQQQQQQQQQPVAPAGQPDYRSSLTTAIGLSLRKKYQRNRSQRRRWHLGQGAAAIGEKVKSAIVKHIQNHQHRKKYRCAYCQERFLSRPLCQAHIRAEHPNSRPMDLDGRSSRGSSKSRDRAGGNSSNNSRMPVSYAQPQTTPAAGNSDGNSNVVANDTSYHMQPFTLEARPEDSQANFAASVVYLPVVSKVSSPVTVTFKLTPTEL